MASTMRLLNDPMYLIGKHLLRRSSSVLYRNIHVFECVNEFASSSCLHSFYVSSSLSSTKRSCVSSAASECHQDAASILRERVNVSQYPRARLEKIISFFVNDGFKVDDVINMIAECPEILRKREKDLEKVISALRSCGMRDEETKQILKGSPKILCCSDDTIISRCMNLKRMFSRESVAQILSRCSNIMFTKWGNVQQNVEYLKKEMMISDKQIAHSSALESPIELIKARHVFLTRAGLFVSPDPKSKLPSNNPSLSKIVDTDDIYFAEKVANLTAEEYFVFLEMFESENFDRENEDDNDLEESE